MKKTLIGIVIMAVAIMMTLSGAVLAADTVSATVSEGTKYVGETVTVTINHTAQTAAYQYTVTYDPTILEFTGNDTAKNGKITVADMDTNYAAHPTNTLTFKALKAGNATVGIENPILTDTDGKKIENVTAGASATFTIAEAPTATPTTAPTATPTSEPTKATAPTTAPTATPTTADGDKVKKGIKNAGALGFDAMYIVYLAGAVIIAAGIVAVARKK